MDKKQIISQELNDAMRVVADILLKARNPLNSWHIQNAFARLGEAEFWALKALDTQLPAMAQTSEPRKDVKFANKKKQSIANKQ